MADNSMIIQHEGEVALSNRKNELCFGRRRIDLFKETKLIFFR